jgi:hypothetical protein
MILDHCKTVRLGFAEDIAALILRRGTHDEAATSKLTRARKGVQEQIQFKR